MTNDHMRQWSSTNVSTRVAQEQQSWSVFDRVWSSTTTTVVTGGGGGGEVEDVSSTSGSSVVVSSVPVWGGGSNATSPDTVGYGDDNWWALLALALVFATAAGNILVCLAISWERRLQNVTNYFLMSLAITDLMVAVLVMPLGILTLVRGFFPLPPVYCLAWICLDVLFCTASIMHLCTISVDRYLSLRYPMKFGRNKTRRRVTLKIVFVWLLSIAMSLPLSLMYSQDYNSVLVEGTCQIPDPLYKLIGSIVSFYIPLGVMLLTYALTVRLLAVQQQNLGGCGTGWSSGWLGGPPSLGMERRCTWRRFLLYTGTGNKPQPATPQHMPSSIAAHHSSTDTDLTTLDTHELWLPESEPTPSTMSALHQFGAEMLRLSRGLENAMVPLQPPPAHQHKHTNYREITFQMGTDDDDDDDDDSGHPPRNGNNAICADDDEKKTHRKGGYRRRRRASTIHEPYTRKTITKSTLEIRRRVSSYHESLNKWTTSESSSAEEQQTKPTTNHNEEDDDDEDDGERLDAVNTCRKHSGVSEHELGYQLLRTDAKRNEHNNDRSSADSEDEADKRETDKKANDGTEEDPLKLLPPPCTCPYFGDSESSKKVSPNRTNDVVIITTSSTGQNRSMKLTPYERRRKLGFNSVKLNDNDSISSCDTRNGSSSIRLPGKRTGSSFASESSGTVVTWESTPTRNRRGSYSSGSCPSAGTVRTMVLSKSTETSPAMRKVPILRRAVTLKMTRKDQMSEGAAQGVLLRYGSASGIKRGGGGSNTVRTHHSRNSSVMSRTSSRHGRIIRLEQKATKVLGVVFFTFVILWAPFFVLNLVPSICAECERNIDRGVFDFVTWLGYASSMVNPIFYTIFNKVFRQAFKKVLLCKYHNKKNWKPSSKAKL